MVLARIGKALDFDIVELENEIIQYTDYSAPFAKVLCLPRLEEGRRPRVQGAGQARQDQASREAPGHSTPFFESQKERGSESKDTKSVDAEPHPFYAKHSKPEAR